MEQWKDIKGYEGYYQISSYGKVKNIVTGNILKPSKSKTGYLHITLCYTNRKDFLIHRLVALAFLQNPNNFPEVNHKDEDKSNNCADNLEWCTAKYNVNYGKGSKARNTKVIQYDLKNNMIKIWESMKEVEEELGIKYQCISRCCSGLRKSTGGFLWAYL